MVILSKTVLATSAYWASRVTLPWVSVTTSTASSGISKVSLGRSRASPALALLAFITFQPMNSQPSSVVGGAPTTTVEELE